MNNISKFLIILNTILLFCFNLNASIFSEIIPTGDEIKLDIPENCLIQNVSNHEDKNSIRYQIFPENKEYILFISVYKKKNTLGVAKILAKKSGESLKPEVKEKKIKLQKIRKTTSPGYYYFLTDKDPEKGEYEYLFQGVLIKNNYTVYFTLFTHSKSVKLPSHIEHTLTEIEFH